MTNETQETDRERLHRETEVILCCLNKPQGGSVDPLMEDLVQVQSLLQQPLSTDPQVDAKQSEKARRLLTRSLQAINLYNHLDVRKSTLKGMVYLYRGVFHHLRDEWSDADERYQDAAAIFKAIPDRLNWAVAVFARGLLNTCHDCIDRVPEIQEAMNTLSSSECQRSVEEIWRQARAAAADRQRAQEAALEPPERLPSEGAPAAGGSGANNGDQDQSESNHPAPRLDRPNESFLRLLVIVAIGSALVGAGIVSRLGGNVMVYGAAFMLAIPVYLLVYLFRKAHEIPARHVALINGFGQSRLREGPDSFRCLPFFQHVRAIIPVYPLTYMFQKQRMPAKGGSVEIGLVVRYQVDYERLRKEKPALALDNVCRVLDCTRDATPKSADEHKSQTGNTPLGLGDLQPLWHRKLVQEIKGTLYQVLPEGLDSNKPGLSRRPISEEIRNELQARTVMWGVAIERVDIAELSTAKD